MQLTKGLTVALCMTTPFAAMSPNVAFAGQVEDDVELALQSILNGDFEGAQAQLNQAEEHALVSDSVVLGRSLASIHFYRGVLEYYNGDRDQKTLDYWRLALLSDPIYSFDTSLVADQEPQDVFEALRSEGRSRRHVEPGIREEIEDVRVFVDGRLLRSHELIVEGRHLVQVMCPDKVLRNSWHEFGEAPDYYATCGAASVGESTPVLETEPVEAPVPEEPKPEREPVNLARIGMVGGGAAMLASGAAANFLWVNPAWENISAARQDPSAISRESANDLTRQFNVARYSTLGLIGAGAAVLTVGFLVDDRVTVVPGPGGGMLVGRF